MKRHKRIVSALVVLLLALLVLPAFTNKAEATAEELFIYTVENDKAIIIGCTKKLAGDIVIPDILGGYPVAGIGNSAFIMCDLLFTITVPETVTTIGNYAFYGCQSLQSITIPNGVIAIGDYTFYDCKRLQSITIPDSVTTIGKNAF